MGLIDDITANHRMRSVVIAGVLACAVTLAGFSVFHRLAQDDGLVGSGETIESILRQQQETLGDLHGRIEDDEKVIKDGRLLGEEADAAARDLVSVRQDVETRARTLEALEIEVRRQQAAFKVYQMDFRDQAWKAAVGEKIPHLALKDGRHYEDASIIKVTAEGLEISHADGRARIRPGDLDATWQHRFDWDLP